MDEPRPPNWRPAAVFADLGAGSGPSEPYEICWLLEEAGFALASDDATDWPFRYYEHKEARPRVEVWLQMDRPIGVVQARTIAEKIDLVWSPEPNGERIP